MAELDGPASGARLGLVVGLHGKSFELVDRVPEVRQWTEYELKEPDDFEARLATTLDIPWIDVVQVALSEGPEAAPQSMVELFHRLAPWP